MEKLELIKKLCELLDSTHSQYHTVENCKNILDSQGFLNFNEVKDFSKLEKGKNYYLISGGSSIIAFKLPANPDLDNLHFQLVSSHRDSPTFKLKPNPILKSNGVSKLNVEPYGGMIYSTWLDKPLSIAGRVTVKKDNDLETRLVDIDRDLLIIPNVPIHMNRNINYGYEYNPQIDLLPILGQSSEENEFQTLMKKYVLKENEELFNHDLYLYNREKSAVLGLNDEFISSSKIDNLECAYLSLLGFIDSKTAIDTIPVYVCFDNEEVGSSSLNGADSTFLATTLNSLLSLYEVKESQYFNIYSKSFMISADNAHAIHPNHPELYDAVNNTKMNEGVVIKFNADMRYCSDSISSSVLELLANKAKVKIQKYTNRSDTRGGSTLGNISLNHVSIPTVDIGLAQLAMHSSYEVAGTEDALYLYNLIKEYYSSSIMFCDNKILIK